MPGDQADKNSAWIMRLKTGDGDVADLGLREGVLILGWSEIEGPEESEGYWDFRDRVKSAYYSNDPTFRRAGRAASAIWQFSNEFREGDLVLVPLHKTFRIARITSEKSRYERHWGGQEDSAHTRSVEWIRDGHKYPRGEVRTELRRKLKYRGTIARVTEHSDEIDDVVRRSPDQLGPKFKATLRERMVATALEELREGYLEDYGFELLAQVVLEAMGVDDSNVIARKLDKGTDILAEYSIHGYLRSRVSIQVKHWDGVAGKEPIDQLLRGMDRDGSSSGIVVTTATFSEDAREYVDEIGQGENAGGGRTIELIDGDDLAGLIVDFGLERIPISI